VVTIRLPPLSQRTGDIPLLTEYFLARFAGEIGIDRPRITTEAQAILNQYPWPGNVRELANVIQKTVIFNRGAPLCAEDIAKAISEHGPAQTEENGEKEEQVLRRIFRHAIVSGTGDNLFEEFMDNLARHFISEALNVSGGNRSRAAKILGLSRPTLHAKMEKYGLKLETSVRDDA
jgi:DNA-binding NtrC family response regulator